MALRLKHLCKFLNYKIKDFESVVYGHVMNVAFLYLQNLLLYHNAVGNSYWYIVVYQ